MGYDLALRLAVAVVAFALMEPWSRWVHDKLWHGPLWPVHRSHHEEQEGWFEANDLFVVGHALAVMPVFLLVAWLPLTWWREVIYGAAIGISCFGVSYALLHDGAVHGRLPVGFLLRLRPIKRIVGAHRAHHVTGEAPYGFFLGPRELQQDVRRRREERSSA